MSISTQYNLKSSAVKRLMKEAEELRLTTHLFHAHPLEDNLFEWHFTIRGPKDSAFEKGIYHGRIIIPIDYPMKPPNIILLTPNGRFETNKKICLSISGYHPETWQPSWSIRTALLAIIGFMPTPGAGSIGSLDYTPEERKSLALKSREWVCKECGKVKFILPQEDNAPSTNEVDMEEAKKLATQISFKSDSNLEDKSPLAEIDINLTTTAKSMASQQIIACTELNASITRVDDDTQHPNVDNKQTKVIGPHEDIIQQGHALLSTLSGSSPSKDMLIRRLESLKKAQVGVNSDSKKTSDNIFPNNLSPQTSTLNDNANSDIDTTLTVHTNVIDTTSSFYSLRSNIWSNFLIFLLVLLLIFLVGRRIYLANAWRLYSSETNRDPEL